MSKDDQAKELKDTELDGAQGGLSISPTTLDPTVEQINTHQTGLTDNKDGLSLNTQQSSRTLSINTHQTGRT